MSCTVPHQRVALSTVATMLLGFIMVLSPSLVWANTYKWDTKADWAKGKSSNVDWNKQAGDLQIFYDPAKQQYNETRFIYIPSSARNTIAKMDTKTGQIIWSYNLTPLGKGNNPSRTTVDSRGNVWVGLRGGSHVIAISQEGKFITAVLVGGGPRAVTVDKNGDIWAGAYSVGTVVKISGATYKPILTINDNRIRSYGATTDSNGNVWISNRPSGNIVKIDVAQGKVVGFYSTPGVYGIAADRRGYVWAASYENSALYQHDAKTGARIKTYGVGAKGRGVSVDGQNKIWVACSNSSAGANTKHVAWVDPFTGSVKTFTSVGLHSIGIAVDAKGFVWANSLLEGYAYVLNSATGAYVNKYPVCDTTGTRPCLCGAAVACTGCQCSNAAASSPYTYSDMTGFQLQVIVAPSSGTWSATYDAKCKAKFNNISWNGSLPSGTKVLVRGRSASTASALSTASWGAYVNKGQPLGIPSNRFIEVQIRMDTQDSRVTPSITDASLSFDFFPEVCDGIDNNCDGAVDENFADLGSQCTVGQGACQNQGKKVCNNNKNGTTCDAVAGQPQKEVCDDIDNNCNGQIDENWDKKGQSCTVGVGACERSGTWICSNKTVVCSVQPGTPGAESCNGKDDDCNGQVDDNLTRVCTTKCGSGQQECKNGRWDNCTAPEPKTETCNDIDDNCDGSVDEGLTRKCKTLCGEGNETCVRGKWQFCDAVVPKDEICDGVDNDCNGQIDDGLTSRSCQGACGRGTASCQNGKWSGCSGPSPKAEECDGKDNDCNGKIDDGLKKSCRSACGDGAQTCRAGTWGNCTAPSPRKEICDGKDNDCNGKIDDQKDLCPSGMVCRDGQCNQQCQGGECAKGLKCVDGLCRGIDPCKDVNCSTGKQCAGGKCIDECFLISCPSDQVCKAGKCIEDNCYNKGCPGSEKCIDGKCVADPCQGVSCEGGKFCRSGTCVSSCFNVTCKSTEKCVEGKCVENPKTSGPCENVKCDAGEHCEKGKCIADPCKGISCTNGRKCIDGACEHDPCLHVQCPQGVCKVVDGTAQCVDKSQLPKEQPPSDAGGPKDGGAPTEQPGKTDQSNPIDNGATQVDGGDIGNKNLGDQGNTGSKPGQSPGGCNCQTNPADSPGPLFWMLALCFLIAGVRLRSKPQ